MLFSSLFYLFFLLICCGLLCVCEGVVLWLVCLGCCVVVFWLFCLVWFDRIFIVLRRLIWCVVYWLSRGDFVDFGMFVFYYSLW